MKLIFFFCWVIGFTWGQAGLFAQEINNDQFLPTSITLYYNLNWELTSPENSFYKREASFDLKDMMFEGIYKDFNKEGKLIGDGYYHRGEKSGMQSEYFEDQSIRATIEYSDKGFIIWQKMTSERKFEVAKGTGKFSLPYYYFYDMRIKQGTLHGEFANGKRIGMWIYIDTGGKKTNTEYYEDGKLKKHILYRQKDSTSVNYGKAILLSLSSINTQSLAFDKNVFSSANEYFEKFVTLPSTLNRLITFPMGIKRLLTILTEELVVPERMLLIAKLKLDERGKILKLNLARSVFDQTDDNALKLLKGYDSLFFPAIENGKPISSVIYLPVASGDEWLEMLRNMPTEYFTNISNFE